MIGDRIDPDDADVDVVETLTAELVARASACPPRLRVAIAGESGSGKSTLAAALCRSLEAVGHPTRLLHQDDYFRLPPGQNATRRAEDPSWVGPGEVRLDLLDAHLQAARDADRLLKPLVDYQADSIGEETVELAGVAVVIVEGTYTCLLAQADLRIFMAGTHQELRSRREERQREDQDEALLAVVAREHALIAPHADRCEWVVGVEGEVVDRGEPS